MWNATYAAEDYVPGAPASAGPLQLAVGGDYVPLGAMVIDFLAAATRLNVLPYTLILARLLLRWLWKRTVRRLIRLVVWLIGAPFRCCACCFRKFCCCLICSCCKKKKFAVFTSGYTAPYERFYPKGKEPKEAQDGFDLVPNPRDKTAFVTKYWNRKGKRNGVYHEEAAPKRTYEVIGDMQPHTYRIHGLEPYKKAVMAWDAVALLDIGLKALAPKPITIQRLYSFHDDDSEEEFQKEHGKYENLNAMGKKLVGGMRKVKMGLMFNKLATVVPTEGEGGEAAGAEAGAGDGADGAAGETALVKAEGDGDGAVAEEGAGAGAGAEGDRPQTPADGESQVASVGADPDTARSGDAAPETEVAPAPKKPAGDPRLNSMLAAGDEMDSDEEAPGGGGGEGAGEGEGEGAAEGAPEGEPAG